MDKELIDIQEYIGTLSKNVQDNVTIVKAPNDNPYLLHGSINGNIKEFIPRLAERPLMDKDNNILEDRTVPRIHVSDFLMGCFEGISELQWYAIDDVTPPDEYKGGWYIYRIPYHYALLPNETLLPDQKTSNEHWLVPYNKQHGRYRGEIIAKLILDYREIINRNQGKSSVTLVFLLEITKGELKIHPGNFKLYGKGYYEVRYDITKKTKIKGFSRVFQDKVSVLEISKEEYLSRKQIPAPNLLQGKSNISKSFDW